VYLRNAALFAFFPVAWYFIYKRSLDVVHSLPALGLFVLGALVVNLYPAKEPSDTAFLAAIHLPIAFLFLLVFSMADHRYQGEKSIRNPVKKRLA
jgi:D-alanyl-lipoteichoic acid acyltransferase DltB (MBOAT superfamily)